MPMGVWVLLLHRKEIGMKPKKYRVSLVTVILIVIWPSQGLAMSFFGSKQSVVIASPLSGVITYEGAPVSNVKVERWLKWKDEDGETQESYTNEKGEFSFPQVSDKVRISPLSVFVITQNIHVYRNGGKATVWSIGKANYELYGEFGGEPKEFTCELTGDGEAVRSDGALIWTSCKWKL
jgi:hypothetical protein